MALEYILGKIYTLKCDRCSVWEKPYKPTLLMTIIDLIESGPLETEYLGNFSFNG